MTAGSRRDTSDHGMLTNNTVAQSHDARIIRDALNGLTQDNHTLEHPRGKSLQGLVNGITLGPMSLGYVRYGSALNVNSPPTGERILVVYPLGEMHVETNDYRYVATKPFALNSAQPTIMIPHQRHGALVQGVAAEDAADYFAKISGREVQQSIRLDRRAPMTLAAAPLVEQTMKATCQTLEELDQPTLPEHTVPALLTSLFSTLLLGLSPFLNCFEPAAATAQEVPSYLSAAEEYMQRNYPQISRISEVADAVGISQRQLQSAFVRFKGVSPQQRLREIRIREAHNILTAVRPGDAETVSTVAHRVGIGHLGRFSSYYHQTYGQSPSKTLTTYNGIYAAAH